MTRSMCTTPCWTPSPCPTCGNDLPPAGRSVPLEFNIPTCCDENRVLRANARHLWSEHDSTRAYTDPIGWACHEATCAQCDPEADDG